MPESISSCGVLNAPPARITSRDARAWRTSPPAALGFGVRAIQPLALQVLDADRAVAVVEQHARGERVSSIFSRSGYRSATSSSRSRVPTRACLRVVSGV